MIMNRLILLSLFVTLCFNAFCLDYWQEREFFEESCLTCHAMNDYLWPRSYKAWQLTIANMRVYVGDDTVLNIEDGERIAEFLTMYTGEGELIVPLGLEKNFPAEKTPAVVKDSEAKPVVQPETQEVETTVKQAETLVETELVSESVGSEATAVETVSLSEPKLVAEPVSPKSATVVQPRLYMPLLKRIWNPGRKALKWARFTGFFGVAFLLGLLLSGFGRKKLKLKFRAVHKKLALGLFIALVVHAVIYIFEYGTPHVLWYWFGFTGSILLIFTQIQGKLKFRLRKGPLFWHITAACIGLSLSVLHWIWAWL